MSRSKAPTTPRANEPGPARLSRHDFAAVLGIALLVGVLTAVVHFPTIRGQAVMSDDDQYIHNNPLVQNPSLASAWRFVSEVLTPSSVSGYYQPLAMISLMTDCAMGGRPDDYRVFHATSLVLHSICSALVVVLIFVLFKSLLAAAAAGLLFGLHPGAVESVAWVSDRKTLLATLFAVSSLICYCKHAGSSRGWSWFVWCVAFYLLALLSKPTTTMLPMAMVLMDFWPLQRLGRRALFEKIPLFVLSVIFGVITIVSQERTANVVNPFSYPLWATPLILCHNIVFYLWKIFWPANLSAYYAWPEPFNLSQRMVQVGLAGTALLGVLLAVSLKWTRAWLTGFLIFLVIIFPAMGIIGFTSTIAADRYAYLPKIGLLLPIGWLIAPMAKKSGARATSIAVICLFLAAAEALLARSYIPEWSDTERMARYLVRCEPQSAYLRSSLGNVLNSRQKYVEAAKAYQEALAIEDDPLAHAGLATSLAAAGRLNEAEQHLQTAIRLYPKLVGAIENLAILQDRMGKDADASRNYAEALRLRPGSVNARYQFGMFHFRRGRLEDARAQFSAALDLDPNHAPTHYQLGCLLVSLGNTQAGIQEWEKAVAASPAMLESLNSLAWVRATADEPALRNGVEAVAMAERACEITQRRDPALLDTLAAAYAEAGRFNEAASVAEASIAQWNSNGNPALLRDARRRLDGYRSGRPHHEPINRDAYRAR